MARRVFDQVFNRGLTGMSVTAGKPSMLVNTVAMYSDGFCMRLQGAEPFCIRPSYPLSRTGSVGWLR